MNVMITTLGGWRSSCQDCCQHMARLMAHPNGSVIQSPWSVIFVMGDGQIENWGELRVPPRKNNGHKKNGHFRKIDQDGPPLTCHSNKDISASIRPRAMLLRSKLTTTTPWSWIYLRVGKFWCLQPEK